MSIFKPEENTMVCMYGPPGSFDDPPETNVGPETGFEKETVFTRIANLLRKLFDFIRNLFSR